VTVYDATPTIGDGGVVQLGSLTPGNSAWVTVYGYNFGAQGTANQLMFTPSAGNICGQPGDLTYSSASNSQQLYWASTATEQSSNLDQINALVTASPTACGDYDVQVTSGGVSGNGFAANPADPQDKPQGKAGTPPVKVTKAAIVLGGANGKDVTGQTVSFIVGQQVVLSGSVSNLLPGVTVSSQKWQIPAGVAVAGYQFGQTPQVCNLDDTTCGWVSALTSALGITFYWIAPNTSPGYSVTFTATLSDGTNLAAPATFAVHAPGLPSFTSVTATPQVDPNSGVLSLGPLNGDGFAATANVALDAGETGSNIGYIQLVNTLHTFTGSNQQKSSGGSFTLDLPPGASAGQIFVQGPQSLPPSQKNVEFDYPTVDTPAFSPFLSDTQLTASDSFQTYLMYQPPGQNSIWVTLGMLQWNWSATATKGTSGWTASGSNPGNPSGSAGSAVPMWKQKVTDLQFTPLQP
jgi:hypothetical protein